MKDGSAPAATNEPPGHFDGPVTTVKGQDIKKNPDAPKKVQPKTVKQDEKKPLNWQRGVELALQQFFRTGWIESDPGQSENINDSKSQAAIKEFQKKFKLKVDGIVGPQTRGVIARQILEDQGGGEGVPEVFGAGRDRSARHRHPGEVEPGDRRSRGVRFEARPRAGAAQALLGGQRGEAWSIGPAADA
jgi:hypothetical protein